MLKVIAVMAAGLMLAGCGGGDEGTGSSASPTASPTASSTGEPSATSTPTETEDPYAPNVGDRALRVGEPRRGSGVITTLLQVRPRYPAPSYAPAKKGQRWFGLRVKTCVRKSSTETNPISWGDWAVIDKQFARYPGASESYDGFPSPQYPPYEELRPGQCRQGWLLAAVPNRAKVDHISFQPGGEAVAEWRL